MFVYHIYLIIINYSVYYSSETGSSSFSVALISATGGSCCGEGMWSEIGTAVSLEIICGNNQYWPSI